MLDLRNVALWAWLLSWTGPLAAYLLSAAEGHVAWCIPHLMGCDSISASGRHGWGYFVFKATMLPAAAFTFAYWVLCVHWLRRLQGAARVDRVMFTLGAVGTVFLVLYVTFLGSEGDVYRMLRRYGTVVYFGCTYLAQLLLARRVQEAEIDSPIVPWLYRLAVFMLFGGLAFATLANFFEDDDFLQNMSEWLFASALTVYPLLVWLLWRHTGFTVEYEMKSIKN